MNRGKLFFLENYFIVKSFFCICKFFIQSDDDTNSYYVCASKTAVAVSVERPSKVPVCCFSADVGSNHSEGIGKNLSVAICCIKIRALFGNKAYKSFCFKDSKMKPHYVYLIRLLHWDLNPWPSNFHLLAWALPSLPGLATLQSTTLPIFVDKPQRGPRWLKPLL